TRSATVDTGLDPVVAARRAEELGAGEILLTSVDRDGTLEGYDLELLASVTAAVTVPVIASGGAGSARHMVEALEVGGASAVAAASVFHFTQLTPREVKEALRESGFAVRL
ncbi:MAG: HisA/HisF-related TIM barrel protein, partial [Acidimicrobiia bacterium]